MEDFGGNGLSDGVWDVTDVNANRAALAVGLAAAVLQIFFGLFGAGILGEFFPSTVVYGTLATDLLIGVAAGILLKIVIHLSNGVPLKTSFKPYIEVQPVDRQTSRIVAHETAVFSNWIPFRRQIEQIGLVQKRNLIVDLSDTRLVDHSVMEKMEEMQQEFLLEGLTLEIQGLDALR